MLSSGVANILSGNTKTTWICQCRFELGYYEINESDHFNMHRD